MIIHDKFFSLTIFTENNIPLASMVKDDAISCQAFISQSGRPCSHLFFFDHSEITDWMSDTRSLYRLMLVKSYKEIALINNEIQKAVSLNIFLQ